MSTELADVSSLLIKEASELLDVAQRELQAEREDHQLTRAKVAQLDSENRKIRLIKVASVDDDLIRRTVNELVEVGFIDKRAQEQHEEMLRDGGAATACHIIQQLAKSAVFLLDKDETTSTTVTKSAAVEDDKLTRVWRDAKRVTLGR